MSDNAPKFKLHHAKHRTDQRRRWAYFSIASATDQFLGGGGCIQTCCLDNAVEQIHSRLPQLGVSFTLRPNAFKPNFKPGLGWCQTALTLAEGGAMVEVMLLPLAKAPAPKDRDKVVPRTAMLGSTDYRFSSQLKRQANAPFQHTARTVPGSLALACKLVSDGTSYAAGVSHLLEGDWYFLCDGSVHTGAHEAEQLVSVHAEHILQADPSLYALADLPIGWAAERDSPTGKWERFELPPDDHHAEE